MAFPYYRYRKKFNNRTVEGLLQYINYKEDTVIYKICLIPFIGIVIILLAFIFTGGEWLLKTIYNKYIKDIKI